MTIFTGIDPYDREGACYRLPKIIHADPNVKWVWCGDTGCDAISSQSAAQALEHKRRDEAEREEVDDRAGRARRSVANADEDEGTDGGGEDDHEGEAIIVRGFATVEDGVEYVKDDGFSFFLAILNESCSQFDLLPLIYFEF